QGCRAKGWRRSGKVVPNWELWSRLLELCEHHRVRFEWVRGHAGHVENERCDELAGAGAGKPDFTPARGAWRANPIHPRRSRLRRTTPSAVGIDIDCVQLIEIERNPVFRRGAET